jgi:hypothetical protein
MLACMGKSIGRGKKQYMDSGKRGTMTIPFQRISGPRDSEVPKR